MYESGSSVRFYVPKQYWHNNNLTLMIDCVKYQQGSKVISPPHSKTVMTTLTLPHKLYVVEDNTVKLDTYSAYYNSNNTVNKGWVYEKFSTDTKDTIDILVEVEPLTTMDYAEVMVFKGDTTSYVITDIYAVVPQTQGE